MPNASPRSTRRRAAGPQVALAGTAMIIAALAACNPYQPGSLNRQYASKAATVGCIDVAVQALADPQAEGPAAKVFVANRCTTRVFVDYPAISAAIKYADGGTSQALVYDPDGSLKPVALDSLTKGWEAFEYHPVDMNRSGRIATSLCLDVSRLDRLQPSADPLEICVRAENTRIVTAEETP